MEDLIRFVLPRTPSLAALAVVTALPLAAAVLPADPGRRARPAALTGLGVLLGSIGLLLTPGLRGPFLADPATPAAQRITYIAAASLLLAGVLCLLTAVILLLVRRGQGRPRTVLASASGLMIGLGTPFAARISLAGNTGAYESHRGVTVLTLLLLLVVAALAAVLLAAGARSATAGVGLGAAAIPVAVLTAASSGTSLIALSTGDAGFVLPAPLVLAAAACVGALGVLVWRAAGPYWTPPGSRNPPGASRESSSRSS